MMHHWPHFSELFDNPSTNQATERSRRQEEGISEGEEGVAPNCMRAWRMATDTLLL
jgi:hypothetical protein